MKSKALQILATLLSLVLLMCGCSAFTTYFSLFIHEQTLSSNWVGIIQAAFFGGYICGTHFSHHIIDRLSHKKGFILTTLLFSILQLALFSIPSVYSWFAMRFFSGILISILYIILESSLLISSKGKRQGFAVSLFMMGLYLSQSTGQFIYDFFNQIEYIAIVSPLLSTLPMLLVKQELNEHTNLIKVPLSTFIKHFPIEMLLCLFTGSLVGIFFVYCPILLKQNSLTVGKAMGVALLGALFFQFPVGSVSDKIDKSTLIRLIAITMFITMISLSMKSLFYPLVFICGGALFSLYPLILAKLATHFDKKSYTSLCSTLLLTYSIGSIIGPLVCAISIPIYFVMICFGALSLMFAMRPHQTKLTNNS
ncbi:MAG: MFS transporter [Rhabdochlamydiaceae bacterium]|nr:MFS transporter [Candidatus Amphrikana amoebophyrae]